MIDTSDSDHVEEIYGLLNLGLQGVAVFFCENVCQKPTYFRRFGAVDDACCNLEAIFCCYYVHHSSSSKIQVDSGEYVFSLWILGVDKCPMDYSGSGDRRGIYCQ